MLSSITVTITALSVLKAVVVISLILVAYTLFASAVKEKKSKSIRFTLFGTALTQMVAVYLICAK